MELSASVQLNSFIPEKPATFYAPEAETHHTHHLGEHSEGNIKTVPTPSAMSADMMIDTPLNSFGGMMPHVQSEQHGDPDGIDIIKPPPLSRESEHAAAPSVVTKKRKLPFRVPQAVKKTAAGKSAVSDRKAPERKTASKKGKVKEPLMLPLEYAKKVQAEEDERRAAREMRRGDRTGPESPAPFLRGKMIYFYGGDLNFAGVSTRKRMLKVCISRLCDPFIWR